jgi:hypothetical protein
MKQLMSSDSENKEYVRHIGRRRRKNFFVYFQSTLAVGAVAIFFTFLDIYLWESVKIVPPVVFINLYIAAVALLFIFAKSSKLAYRIPVELIVWCSGYATVSFLSFLLLLSLPSYPGEAGLQQLRTRILSEVFLLIMFVIFSKYPKVQNITRLAICFATIVAIFNNILELSDPSIFGVLNNTGRAAGLYVNPNITGCALMLGLIFGIGILPQSIRIIYAVIVLIGIILTFSRGAMIGWVVVMGIFYATHLIPRRQLVIGVISIIGISVIFGSALSGLFDLDELQRSGMITANFDNIRERLEWFQNPKSEDSADSRLEVVAIAWKMFGDHPLFGNGLASTDNLNNWGISTHNMYLLHIADHGILGILILPTLVYAVLRNAQGESKYVGWAFGAFILLWGFFSHNILEERDTLMCFALLAAMNRSSRLKRRQKSFHHRS